jgi:hypothetical protein
MAGIHYSFTSLSSSKGNGGVLATSPKHATRLSSAHLSWSKTSSAIWRSVRIDTPPLSPLDIHSRSHMIRPSSHIRLLRIEYLSWLLRTSVPESAAPRLQPASVSAIRICRSPRNGYNPGRRWHTNQAIQSHQPMAHQPGILDDDRFPRTLVASRSARPAKEFVAGIEITQRFFAATGRSRAIVGELAHRGIADLVGLCCHCGF